MVKVEEGGNVLLLPIDVSGAYAIVPIHSPY